MHSGEIWLLHALLNISIVTIYLAPVICHVTISLQDLGTLSGRFLMVHSRSFDFSPNNQSGILFVFFSPNLCDTPDYNLNLTRIKKKKVFRVNSCHLCEPIVFLSSDTTASWSWYGCWIRIRNQCHDLKTGPGYAFQTYYRRSVF